MTALPPPPSQSSIRGLARAATFAKRQWWIVVLCALVAALGAVGYTKAKKVTYTAGSIVTVSAPTSASANASTPTPTTSTAPDAPSTDIAAGSVTRAAAKAAGLPSVTLSATLNTAGTAVAIDATAPSPQQAILAANAAATAYAAKQEHSYLAQAAAYQKQIDSLSTEIDRLTKASRGAPTDSADKTKLTVLDGQLSTLLTDQYGPQLAASYVGVTTPASASTVGANKPSHKVILLALVAGLLAGLGIALMREQLDDRLRAPSEIADGKHDVLAELPTSSSFRRTGTIADDPSGQLAEAVRALRTALRFLSVKRPLHTVLVTSAAGGEGKTFVAVNLATAWAMSGARTVLVSSDLRQPTVEAALRVGFSEGGLSEAIADAALNGRLGSEGGVAAPTQHQNGLHPTTDLSLFNLDGLLMPTAVEGLTVLPAGPMPPNPAELLGSPEMSNLLALLRTRADVIVLDSPPVLAVTDALVLTAHVDGVLFVAAQNRTSRGALRRGLRAIEGGMAPVLGIVVNRATRPDDTYYFRNRARRLRKTARPGARATSSPSDQGPKHRAPRAARAAAQPATSASSPTTS